MKKVEGWMTTDGSFFEDQKDAISEQKQLDFLFELREIASEYTHSDEAEKDLVKVLAFSYEDIIKVYGKYDKIYLWKNQEE